LRQRNTWTLRQAAWSICPPKRKAAKRLTGVRRDDLKPAHHKQKQGGPAIKAQVAGQRPKVVEEVFPRDELLAHELVVGVPESEHGMRQKSQQIKGCHHGGEILIPMAEVMSQMIAFGFQGVIVLIFDLPTGASGQNNLGDVFLGDFMVGTSPPALRVVNSHQLTSSASLPSRSGTRLTKR
jgi:hypothetical protein